jgi:hypothetical protein
VSETRGSTVALVWAALLLVAGLALGLPAIERNGVLSGQAAFHLFLAVLAIAIGYSGYRLRQGRAGGRMALLIIGTIGVALAIVLPAPLMIANAVVNLAIVGLVWQRARNN